MEVELMRPTLWLGLGGCPTKLAFTLHWVGKLGVEAERDTSQGQARIWFRPRVKWAAIVTAIL